MLFVVRLIENRLCCVCVCCVCVGGEGEGAGGGGGGVPVGVYVTNCLRLLEQQFLASIVTLFCVSTNLYVYTHSTRLKIKVPFLCYGCNVEGTVVWQYK